jgi:hypothetical protein
MLRPRLLYRSDASRNGVRRARVVDDGKGIGEPLGAAVLDLLALLRITGYREG